MRNYAQETEKRVKFIRGQLKNAGAGGIVYGNSGGKDSALVGILCKKACADTLALIMPCISASNYDEDMSDAMAVSNLFHIETRLVDLTKTAAAMKDAVGGVTDITNAAQINIAPRLRMTALYAVAASEGRLVAGTGNKSEAYMGYFTKWGDGACDFNPIADLTVSEVYEFLNYLKAPVRIITKPPSAGLYDGQTDEDEMGVTYKAIDDYLASGVCDPGDMEIIARYHNISMHKRAAPAAYGE